VLIVSGPGGDARRYRGDHRREQLELAGVETDICYRSEVELSPLAERYGCIVLYRVPWDEDVAALVGGGGATVVCDFDDLVFDPAAAGWLRALDTFEAEARREFVDGMGLLRRTLVASGRATVSTAPLARMASDVPARAAVVPNVVSAEMVRQAEAARPWPGEGIRVGYLSGTATHDRDFAEAADGLLWALHRYPDLRLVVAGFLDLDSRFDAHSTRLERLPYRPWQELPALLATLDVNLAPLELRNPFTEAKSCLKFLEAALLGVPTIATPTPDFARVIEHGTTSLLAGDDAAWRETLGELIESPATRRRLGDAARREVLTAHTTSATAQSALDALAELAPETRLDVSET
jgi:glycosyltransferase involved in cell wall biosynthesis